MMKMVEFKNDTGGFKGKPRLKYLFLIENQ